MKPQNAFNHLLRVALGTSMLAGAIASTDVAHAQSGSAINLAGAWRSDVPAASGIVQTFRFARDGRFDLISAVAVDGRYRLEGNRLIETVALPGTGVAGTDTATVMLAGDSLLLGNPASTTGKTLHRQPSAQPSARPSARPSPGSTAQGIVGDWVIMLPTGLAATYHFDADGSMRIRAQVSDERGSFTVSGSTLRLSSERTFQIPATTAFAVSDTTLTLSPPNGKAGRSFHRVDR